MASLQHEFADSESSWFLHGEPKPASTSAEFHGRKGARRRVKTIISSFLPYLILMVGIFLALGLIFDLQSARGKNLIPSQSMFSKIPKKLVVFNPDETYNVDPFEPSQEAWNKLNPAGKGHIRIDNPAALKLSGGFPLDDFGAEEYTISLFHQMHCLAAVKSKLELLRQWLSGEGDRRRLEFSLAQDNMRDQHIYHCIDYLRQAIMCNGDTTLEKGQAVNGKPTQGVDGWGVTHECRDYQAIFDLAVAHRTRNVTGIE